MGNLSDKDKELFLKDLDLIKKGLALEAPDGIRKMSTIISCPYYIENGLSRYCMKGNFPVDCKTCKCQDKNYVTTQQLTTIKDNNSHKE